MGRGRLEAVAAVELNLIVNNPQRATMPATTRFQCSYFETSNSTPVTPVGKMPDGLLEKSTANMSPRFLYLYVERQLHPQLRCIKLQLLLSVPRLSFLFVRSFDG